MSAPRFSPGDRVRIALRNPPVHHRTPAYLRGHIGVVERLCEPAGQPEELAYGRDGEPFQMVYRVRVGQPDLWPDYDGQAGDSLEVEIFEHWLEPAGEREP